MTDADVVLGLVRADGFLDGRMPLDAEGARAAIAKLGSEIGLSLEQAAAGILQVNNAAAANLIRQRTIQQGLDPRDFTLYVFGGAGPVHVWGFASELGVSKAVIPLGNGASTLSAYGIATCDVVLQLDRACDFSLPLDMDALREALGELDQSAAAEARAAGLDPASLTAERTCLLRYRGQFFQSLSLPLPDPAEAMFNSRLREAFEREYARLYGKGALVLLQDVELFALRTRLSRSLGASVAADRGAHPKPASHQTRRVFWPTQMDWIETPVWDGTQLHGGDRLDGPAIVELPHTSVALAPGHRLEVDTIGNYVVHSA